MAYDGLKNIPMPDTRTYPNLTGFLDMKGKDDAPARGEDNANSESDSMTENERKEAQANKKFDLDGFARNAASDKAKDFSKSFSKNVLKKGGSLIPPQKSYEPRSKSFEHSRSR